MIRMKRQRKQPVTDPGWKEASTDEIFRYSFGIVVKN